MCVFLHLRGEYPLNVCSRWFRTLFSSFYGNFASKHNPIYIAYIHYSRNERLSQNLWYVLCEGTFLSLGLHYE